MLENGRTSAYAAKILFQFPFDSVFALFILLVGFTDEVENICHR